MLKRNQAPSSCPRNSNRNRISDDPTLDKGQEVGEIGKITLTTIYAVDERDGTIEETTSRQITKEMVKDV